MDPQGRSGRCVAAYGSEGQGFESLQARQRKSPCCGAYGLLLLRGVPGVRRAIAQPSTLVSSPSANMLRPDLIRPDRLDARDPRDARRPSDGGQRRGTRTCVSRRAQPCGRRVAAWRMVRAVLRVVVFPFFLLHLNNVLCTPRKLSRLDWLPASATTCRTTTCAPSSVPSDAHGPLPAGPHCCSLPKAHRRFVTRSRARQGPTASPSWCQLQKRVVGP